MSESQKGKPKSETHKEAIRLGLIGKTHSDTHKENNSKSHVGLYSGDRNYFFGKNLSGKQNGFYGKTHDEETKRLNSEWHKGRPTWNKGIPMREETKRKLSEAQKGKDNNPANHNRWHTSRGLYKENCRRCRENRVNE